MNSPAELVEHRDSPYFGLDYYQEKFGAWFFGREAEGGKVITNLRAARLTLLHAESGVGKSSLLRAGVAGGCESSLTIASHAGARPELSRLSSRHGRTIRFLSLSRRSARR